MMHCKGIHRPILLQAGAISWFAVTLCGVSPFPNATCAQDAALHEIQQTAIHAPQQTYSAQRIPAADPTVGPEAIRVGFEETPRGSVRLRFIDKGRKDQDAATPGNALDTALGESQSGNVSSLAVSPGIQNSSVQTQAPYGPARRSVQATRLANWELYEPALEPPAPGELPTNHLAAASGDDSLHDVLDGDFFAEKSPPQSVDTILDKLQSPPTGRPLPVSIPRRVDDSDEGGIDTDDFDVDTDIGEEPLSGRRTNDGLQRRLDLERAKRKQANPLSEIDRAIDRDREEDDDLLPHRTEDSPRDDGPNDAPPRLNSADIRPTPRRTSSFDRYAPTMGGLLNDDLQQDICREQQFCQQMCDDGCCRHGWGGGDVAPECGFADSSVACRDSCSGLSLNSLFLGETCRPLDVGGWTSGGYHDRANGLFNDHPDSFNVHQTWLYLHRKADASRHGLGWGYRADAMYGVDAANTQSFGNPPGTWDFQNGADHGRYGWALPQAYLEVATEDMSVIVGHFYTLIGYEVVPANGNFFYSHAITMNLSEPFTHTGVLATKTISKSLELYSGWTLGWDTGFEQLNQGNSYLGGAKIGFGNNSSCTYMATGGNFGSRGRNAYSHSVVFDFGLTDKLNYVVQSDLVRVGSTNEDNVGVNQYLFYSVSERVTLGARMEWWKGDVLTGYAPFGSTLPDRGSLSYYESTAGMNIRVTDNLVFRPEYRHDWSPALGYSVGTGAVDFVLTY